MSLCDLCRSIPLRQLPLIPESYQAYTNGWEYALMVNGGWGQERSPQTGFQFWSNLDDLKRSATKCDLCNLILSSVEKVNTTWENVTEERLAKCSTRPYRPTFEMHLWGRTIGEGFVVITQTEQQYELQIVAAVGFSVPEGVLHLLLPSFTNANIQYR
jgi:hypothetical protein